MNYQGGKHIASKYIVEILNQYRKPNQILYDFFTGGANIVSKMDGARIAIDAHEELIELYKAIQNGWIPPDNVSEEEYRSIKQDKQAPKYLRAFVGFGCSFAGKYFGGYARDKTKRNYSLGAKTGLLKKFNSFKEVDFVCSDYQEIQIVDDSLVYCDPPYANSLNYRIKFDHDQFWNWCRKISINNTVFISEYVAPEDFECIWERQTPRGLRKKTETHQTEKLFCLKGSIQNDNSLF